MKIEILIKKGDKADENKARHMAEALRFMAKELHASVEIDIVSNFGAYNHLAVNPSQAPIVIINGKVEFAGEIPVRTVLQKKMGDLIRGADLF